MPLGRNTIKLVEEIVREGSIDILYQPVVSLVDGNVLGYEALCRGRKGTELEDPNVLFNIAKRLDRLNQIKLMCLKCSVDSAKDSIKEKLLFVNIDPEITCYEAYNTKSILEYLKRISFSNSSIILDIKEKSYISDVDSFRVLVKDARDNDFKLSIDDTGSGLLSLTMLSETNANYLKISMDLIRNIYDHRINQSIISLLLDFTLSTRTKLIAKGVETVEELEALIEMGIQYGQGFLFGQPGSSFDGISVEKVKLIKDIQKKKQRYFYNTPNTIPIGTLAKPIPTVAPEDRGSKVDELLKKNAMLQGIPVVKDGDVEGLVMRSSFFAQLATQYGVAVFMKRPIRLLMDKTPMVVDCNTPLSFVSKAAVSRKEENLYDYIIITKDEKYCGVTTVKNLLEFTTEIELNRAKQSNPLTGLPGNMSIEEKLNKAIVDAGNCFVMYLDLDNFKCYNDVYGFDNGDRVIVTTAEIIKESIEDMGLKDSFIGHIGGDDFVAVICEQEAESLCRLIIRKFDSCIKEFYSPHDRENGYITAKNRHLVEENIPLMSISIAVSDLAKHEFSSSGQLSEYLSHIKKKCKSIKRSCYIIE